MSVQTKIPGYVAGTWTIDRVRSTVSFKVGLLGLTKVRGSFEDFKGTILLAENPLESSVNAVIKTGSVQTKNKKRDEHLHHDDFLNVEQYPTMTFASTGIRLDGDQFLVDGDLTLRAVTKPVTLNLKCTGIGAGQAAFSASTEISSSSFGVTRGKAAFAVSDTVRIVMDIQAMMLRSGPA